MTVLIISLDGDWAAQQVAARLAARGVAHVRMDTGRFPAQASLAATLTTRLGDGWSGTFAEHHGSAVRLEEVSAVYYRRPSDFTTDAGMSGPETRFARAQARAGLGGVLACLDAVWVNHPSAIADAEYKPRQLAIAKACGFTVPATLISNDPDAVRAFAADTGPLVVKTLDDPFVAEAGDYTAFYTRLVTEHDLSELAGVARTAHLFQAWVPKAFEVRLIAAGQALFAVAIHAESQAARVDWRADYAHHNYELTDTPQAVGDSVRRYLAAFGLIYGAFDFVVTPQGCWTFLECNSGGQWGWLAETLNLPIAEAIADALTKETSR